MAQREGEESALVRFGLAEIQSLLLAEETPGSGLGPPRRVTQRRSIFALHPPIALPGSDLGDMKLSPTC